MNNMSNISTTASKITTLGFQKKLSLSALSRPENNHPGSQRPPLQPSATPKHLAYTRRHRPQTGTVHTVPDARPNEWRNLNNRKLVEWFRHCGSLGLSKNPRLVTRSQGRRRSFSHQSDLWKQSSYARSLSVHAILCCSPTATISRWLCTKPGNQSPATRREGLPKQQVSRVNSLQGSDLHRRQARPRQ